MHGLLATATRWQGEKRPSFYRACPLKTTTIFLLLCVVCSTFYGLECFSWMKLGGLLLSFLGTVLVGVSDQGKGGNGTDSVLGDALCLLSAIM